MGIYSNLGRCPKNVKWPSQLYVTNGAKLNVLRQQQIIFHVSVGELGRARWFMLKVCHAAVVRSVRLHPSEGWTRLDVQGGSLNIDVSWSCLSAKNSSGAP